LNRNKGRNVTQYPGPYQGPSYYSGDPYDELSAPAKRAGTLLIIIGAIGLMCGICVGVVGSRFDPEQFPPEHAQRIQEMEEQIGGPVTVMSLRFALIAGLPSLAMLIMGIFVYRSATWAIYGSLVLVGIVLVFVAANVLGSLYMLARQPDVQSIIGVCLTAVMLALFVLLMAWLIQAARKASELKAAQRDYAAQYWQYAHQQQMYGQPPQPGQTMPPPPAGQGPVDQIQPPAPPPPPPPDRPPQG
jgi:hypothetical protein